MKPGLVKTNEKIKKKQVDNVQHEMSGIFPLTAVSFFERDFMVLQGNLSWVCQVFCSSKHPLQDLHLLQHNKASSDDD